MNPDPRPADLPATIPLLPLDSLLLLPETALPLSVTDLWSRAILDAALAADGYVGVIQTLDEEARNGERRFYSVGCLGRVHDLGRDGEGHRVLLEGMIRFRVREELAPAATSALPRGAVSYEEFAGDLLAGREDLSDLDLEAFKRQIVGFGREHFGDAGVLESLPPLQAVLFTAQTAPFTPAERQALLEAPTVRAIIDQLFRLLALNFLTSTPDGSPGRVN